MISRAAATFLTLVLLTACDNSEQASVNEQHPCKGFGQAKCTAKTECLWNEDKGKCKLKKLARVPIESTAPKTLPPLGAQLYVVWGHSEAGGHDTNSMKSAPPLMHGDHVWALEFKTSGLTQTQSPPANPFGSSGPSPISYFADELIKEGKAKDVVLLKCSGGIPGQDWRVGINGAIYALDKCTRNVKYAVEAMKLRLSGGVTFCCAGDALKEEQARAFPENYRKLISSFREAMGDPALPFVSAITPLTRSCNKKRDAIGTIKLLRSVQAETKVEGATWVDFRSAGLPKSCFHLKGAEQVELGRKMARAVQPLPPLQKRSPGIGEGL